MKKKVFKTVFATVCVVVAGISGMKAYYIADQSKADMLLAMNVEALSQSECTGKYSITIDDYLNSGESSGESYGSSSQGYHLTDQDARQMVYDAISHCRNSDTDCWYEVRLGNGEFIMARCPQNKYYR